MMGDENDFNKLSLEEKCQHKTWKARVSGYVELEQLFSQETNENSPIFSNYLHLIKSIIHDNNVMAQEKGLTAVLTFVENSSCAGKVCNDIMNGIVTKCISSPKEKIKELSLSIIFMYIEIEKHDLVLEELSKGLESKSPKIVAACVAAITNSLQTFGPKVVNLKPIFKHLGRLLEDRDKIVREKTKVLTKELYRWIKEALRPQLTNLKPVQMNELEIEFLKVKDEIPEPTRLQRSQKAKLSSLDCTNGSELKKSSEIHYDPYEFLEEIDLFRKLPKDFFENCEGKKWQSRKEALEMLLQYTTNVKLVNADYSEIVRLLKKIISKDTNILVVALGAKCLANLAHALRKDFNPYSLSCMPILLEKFKEKKHNVVQALRDAIDAILKTTTFEATLPDIQAALDNKNPKIKAETALCLSRSFKQVSPQHLTKKVLKPICTLLIKTLNDTDPTVREASAEALGSALKIAGDRIVSPFLQDIDSLKMAKIKEASDKSLSSPLGLSNKDKVQIQLGNLGDLSSLPSKIREANKSKISNDSCMKTVKLNNAQKHAPCSKQSSQHQNTSISYFKFEEPVLKEEEVVLAMTEFISAEMLNGLSNSNWKERLRSLEYLKEMVTSKENIPIQALIKTLAKNKGLKENNPQTMKAKLELLNNLIERRQISKWSLESCLTDIVEKIGDAKVGPLVCRVLSNLAESTSLDLIAQEVLQVSFAHKNPKNQSEALIWVSNAIKEFGQKVTLKTLISHLILAFSSNHTSVKNAAFSLLATLYLYVGPPLRTYFESLKPALLHQIDLELSKHHSENPPLPTRTVIMPSSETLSDAPIRSNIANNPSRKEFENPLQRQDIGELLNASLLESLSDKNWKARSEALSKIELIFRDVKHIKLNIGDLLQNLGPRLNDANKNLIIQALAIYKAIANSLGPCCEEFYKECIPLFFACLANSKASVRNSAKETLNSWLEHCNLQMLFEANMIVEALNTENIFQRVELLQWLTDKLTSLPKSCNHAYLATCLPTIFICMEDKNSEVRRKAQDILAPIMIHVGFETLYKLANAHNSSSRAALLSYIQKLKLSESSPKRMSTAKPRRSSSQHVTISPNKENRDEKNKVGIKVPLRARSGSRLNKNDEENTPQISKNNFKDIRIIDEKALKTLKWNFDIPRKEFYNQLKLQMTSSNWGCLLISYCFHSDFKFHIKAIDVLKNCLKSDIDATISNLDLILKWFSLRFFDTNPCVLLHGLDYLELLVNALSDKHYRLHELEASSFLPYLILKIGDPKDSIRKYVKAILMRICEICPASKIFSFLVQGLTSKNARQRAECLEELGSLFEHCGIHVSASPSHAFKEIAKHILDKDSTVRNSALNCILKSYAIDGERVLKYVGHLPEKSKDLLEERLRRGQAFSQRETKDQILPIEASNLLEASSPPQEAISQVEEPKTEEPKLALFKLDIEGIEKQFKKQTCEPQLPDPVEINIEDIFRLPEIKLPETKSKIPPASKAYSDANNLNIIISQLSDAKLRIVNKAFQKLLPLIQNDAATITPRIEQILLMSSLQLKLAHSIYLTNEETNKDELFQLFWSLSKVLLCIFENGKLAFEASRNVLQDLLANLITFLVHEKLPLYEQSNQIIKTLNVMVSRLLQSCDPTCVMSALLKLLHDMVGSVLPTDKRVELILKCMWKMVRMMDQYINRLDLTAVMQDINMFLKAYPVSFWKAQPTELPLRTIKTILFHIVQRTENILEKIETLPGFQGSDLEFYVKKIILTFHSDESHQMTKSNNDFPSKSNALQSRQIDSSPMQSLAKIFEKIGSEDTSNEGIINLYHWKLKNKDVSLKDVLKNASPSYLAEIESKLQMVEKDLTRSGERNEATVLSPLSFNHSIQKKALKIQIPENLDKLMPEELLSWLKSISAQLNVNVNKYEDENFVKKVFKLVKNESCLERPFTEKEMMMFKQNLNNLEHLTQRFKKNFQENIAPTSS